MIIKTGFEVTNIAMEDADILVEEIKRFVSEWAMNKSNNENRKTCSWIKDYMFEKSIENEAIRRRPM